MIITGSHSKGSSFEVIVEINKRKRMWGVRGQDRVVLGVSAPGVMVTPDKTDAADREMVWNNGVDASTFSETLYNLRDKR